MDHPVDRRGFLAAAVPLCCETPRAPSTLYRFDGDRLHIDRQALPRPGSAITIREPARNLNLIVFQPKPNEFYCLSRICTHGGAMCAYNRWRKSVQCTSLNHAEYDFQGRLLHGRTHGNLRSYPVEIQRRQLLIQL